MVKSGGANKAFLAQIAYDPFELAANGYKLEKSTFTGTLLRADWDDNLIDGTVFEKGKMIQGFTNPANATANPAKPALENARTQNCRFLRVEYTTSYVDTDGVFTLVGHTAWMVQCDISGNGGWDGGGGQRWGYGERDSVGGGGGGVGGTVAQMDSSGAYYDPLVHSGEGYLGGNFPSSALHNFNIDRAIAFNGTDRMKMNSQLKNALFATELAANISTWTYAKADALARAASLRLRDAFPLTYKGLTRVGIVSAVYGGWKAYLVLKDGGELTTDEMITLAAAVVGVASVFVTGWIAVGVGVVSIGITIYQEKSN